MGRFINYHNVCIRFGTWEERRMNHLPPQCRIMRQTLSNLTFLPTRLRLPYQTDSDAALLPYLILQLGSAHEWSGVWTGPQWLFSARRSDESVMHIFPFFPYLFIFFHSFFPFLFTCRYLYKDDLIPKGTKFIGYARSDLTVAKLRAKTEPFMKVNQWCWVWCPYRSF